MTDKHTQRMTDDEQRVLDKQSMEARKRAIEAIECPTCKQGSGVSCRPTGTEPMLTTAVLMRGLWAHPSRVDIATSGWVNDA